MATYIQDNLTDHIVPEWLRMECMLTKIYDNNQYNTAIGNTTNSYMSHYLDYDDYLLDSTFPEDHNLTLNHLQDMERHDLRAVENFLYSRVIVILGVFGLIGNSLNLIILSHKSLQASLGRMEKFAYAGLTTLAISDMLFCLTVLPMWVVDIHRVNFPNIGFHLVYLVYSNGLINMCIMASTWLTVTLAAGRYFVICYPLKAREIIGLTTAKRSLVCQLVLCVLFNLPRFWYEHIESIECPDGTLIYFREYGMRGYPLLYNTYCWLYFIMVMIIPLLILCYCNIKLVKALKLSPLTQDATYLPQHTFLSDNVSYVPYSSTCCSRTPADVPYYSPRCSCTPADIPYSRPCVSSSQAAIQFSCPLHSRTPENIPLTSPRCSRTSADVQLSYPHCSRTLGTGQVGRHITFTLIVLIIMHLLLVCPVELMTFLGKMILTDHSMTDTFNMTLAVLNTLQALNFSVNFILYCMINAHFRRTMSRMMRQGLGSTRPNAFSTRNTSLPSASGRSTKDSTSHLISKQKHQLFNARSVSDESDGI